MGANDEYLSIGEFTRRIDASDNVLTTHLKRIESKLDGHSERIAVLEAAESRTRRSVRRKTIGWGSAVTGGIGLAVSAAKAWFNK